VLRDNKTTFVWAAIVCILVAGFAAWRKERLEIEKLTGEPNRVTLSATPNELIRVFDGRTSAQGTQLAKAYEGKWLRVNGAVRDVHSDSFGESIDLETPFGEASVFLGFEKKWRDTLSALRKGDTVTVLGQIHRVDPHYINLRNCDLIETRVADGEPESQDRHQEQVSPAVSPPADSE